VDDLRIPKPRFGSLATADPAKKGHAIATGPSIQRHSRNSLSIFVESDVPYGIVIFHVRNIVRKTIAIGLFRFGGLNSFSNGFLH
jgi:hypothetical protein